MQRKIYFPILVLICLQLVPDMGFCWQRSRVKHIVAITGNKDIGHFGILGSVFFDERKNRLYVVDSTNNRILSFNSDFKFLAEFSGGGALSFPSSLVKDKHGRFFVAEPTQGQVILVDIAQNSIQPMDFSAVPEGNSVHPGNMAVDSEDRLYIVDKANQRILVFDPSLKFERQIFVKYGQGLRDVKVDSEGFVYTLSTIKGIICVFDSHGKFLYKFGKRGSGSGQFRFPVSLAVSRQGLVYVLDQHMGKVLVFNKKGEFLFDFSQFGWREGRLYFPSYLYINSSGQIFIVDRGNARVCVFE